MLIFLTGLGPVTPTVPDGAPPNILTDTTAPINVYFGGVPSKPTYKGLSPQYPGLYQINVVVPTGVPAGSNIPLAIEPLTHSTTKSTSRCRRSRRVYTIT